MTAQEHLVTTDWLEARLYDPGVHVVDVRGQVETQTAADGSQTAAYRGAAGAFEAGHIPGAVYIDWTADIVDENDPVPAQVAPPEKLARVFGKRGIGDGHLVIAYDDHPTSQFATRLWWVLRYSGHDAVRVLDGGFRKWVRENRPVETTAAYHEPATFTPRICPEWRATARDVMEQMRQPGTAVVDARDRGQYTGEIRRGKRGGRIPGAVHLPREALIDPETGSFLPAEQIEKIVTESGLREGQRVIAYCNGGVAATSVLFALSLIGRNNLSNYDGSWNEWGNRDDLPVEP